MEEFKSLTVRNANMCWLTILKRTEVKNGCMMKYECIVERSGIVRKIIRYFTTIEDAFAWLKLEGYKVISIKELT